MMKLFRRVEMLNTEKSKLHCAETDKPSVNLYGFFHEYNCNQWANYKEAKVNAEES